MSLKIGSRESPLALSQAHHVMGQLQQVLPKLDLALNTFKTQGDLILEKPLSQIGDKGLFVKELERALLDHHIDVAVHSLKDLPSVQPQGLSLCSGSHREDARDVLISSEYACLADIPSGSTIGTSSLRRAAQLGHIRPDLMFKPVRGNVQTRLSKLDQGHYSGLVMAAAGLKRLGLTDRITEYFDPFQTMVPAVAQGILGLEFRSEDTHTQQHIQALCLPEVEIAMTAERAFLRHLEGGCQVPIGAYAVPIEGSSLYTLVGVIASLSGEQLLKETRQFNPDHAEQAGIELAKMLLEKGGRTILAGITRSTY